MVDFFIANTGRCCVLRMPHERYAADAAEPQPVLGASARAVACGPGAARADRADHQTLAPRRIAPNSRTRPCDNASRQLCARDGTVPPWHITTALIGARLQPPARFRVSGLSRQGEGTMPNPHRLIAPGVRKAHSLLIHLKVCSRTADI